MIFISASGDIRSNFIFSATVDLLSSLPRYFLATTQDPGKYTLLFYYYLLFFFSMLLFCFDIIHTSV
ncbi:hypothetical protein M6B38_158650 [Iris pallida]|uniref:Uncharacterized protein n=1 Tax=Iris pallida TaxID=29817 RepID=A0AAX6F0X6_IRIPA|nr:hypothetical protein M6B38_159475 [Iris pallida]KAJ6810276.1 hypothetical protein M6B38_158650 [Iris pallida]